MRQIHSNKIDSLRWFSQRRSRTPHLGGAHPGGLRPPNSNSAEIFVQCPYPQLSSSYVYSFGSYRVDKQTHTHTNTQTIKQTNRQTPLKTPNVLRYATTSGKHNLRSLVIQRRSVAKSVGCFQRRLFVCLFVSMILSERVNIGRWNLRVGASYKNIGRVRKWGSPSGAHPARKVWRSATTLGKSAQAV